MTTVHPIYIPAPYQDAVDSGRLILRDGSAATIRIATLTDCDEMREFFSRLSAESREHRFLTASGPSGHLVEFLCGTSNPAELLTLVVTRQVDQSERIVATGSYIAKGDRVAEVAMAVDDRVQGVGIGTHLLERLAIIAIRNGFVRFWAVTQMENRAMIEVFRHSGFSVRERLDSGLVEIDFDVTPTESSVHLSELRDRLFTAASIRPFFKPNAVAVIGASRDRSSIGYRILDELLRAGFQGSVFPVNPNARVVKSMRTYRSIREVPEPIDLAIIAAPRDAVAGAVDDCAARGVRAVVIVSAGFAEVDSRGRELQQELLAKVRGYGMRMVGPNCMGLLNTDPGVLLNASFSPVFPPAGVLAMSSQSGALGLAVLAFAAERHLGFSTFISVGNKADVSGNDLLQYWETDNATGVILLYLESFGNPRRFARIARRVGRSKPIVAVKAGRTLAGRRAAGSHTAALAANDVAVDALFRQTGVIRAETLDELFDIAAALGSQPLPAGRRVGIVTNAGGPGILCTDACEAQGLTIPELSSATQSTLRTFLPAAASVGNPVDMVASASPESYRDTVKTVLASPDVDALVIIYIPVDRDDSSRISVAIREGVEHGRAAGAVGKPVLACLMAGGMRQQPLRTSTETIPLYAFPESAAKVIAKCAAYSEWKNEPPGVVPMFDDIDLDRARSIVRNAIVQRGPGWLSPAEVYELLKAFQIPQPESRIVHTADEAAAAAAELGFPVALKLVSSSVLHKTEAGGVRLNLADTASVQIAFASIASDEGVLVQKMVKEGVELMMGLTADPLFGPLIAFGLGGIHVEIMKDVVFRITPLTERDAHEMVRGVRGYRLLEGYRGHDPADVAAIENTLLRLSLLAEGIPEITEMDLNPIIAHAPGKGCVAVDVRLRVNAR